MSGESETRMVQSSSRVVRIQEVDDGLELSYHWRLWGTPSFLLLWLMGWTAGTGFLLWNVFTNPSVLHALYAVPFVAAWLLVFVLLAWMLFGREGVRIDSEGLEYQTTLLLPLSRRTVPLTELKNVSADLADWKENDMDLRCLRFETMGQPLRFAAGIGEQEQHWLVERLNEYLDLLRPHGTANGQKVAPIVAEESCQEEILRRASMPIEPPSDSRIDVSRQAETVEFLWQGEWSLGTIAGISFIILFWNGAVSVFLWQCYEDPNVLWFSFFVVLHAAFGLFLFAVWFVALTAPLWRLTWTFGEHQITRRLSVSDANAVVFDFGWSKRFAIQPFVRLALRRQKKQSRNRQLGSLLPLLSHPDGEHSLSFLAEEGKELLTLKHLTEGDARWIADVLLRTFPSWGRGREAAARISDAAAMQS